VILPLIATLVILGGILFCRWRSSRKTTTLAPTTTAPTIPAPPPAPARPPRKFSFAGLAGWLVFIALVAGGGYWGWQKYQSSKTPAPWVQLPSTAYDPLINSASQKYGVDVRLIKAVIQQESGFKPGITGDHGEKGLMQLMPETVERYGVKNPFDPAENIDAGTHYLADLLKKYNGNVNLALAAYNCGADCVDSGKIPLSTQQHVVSVMAILEGRQRPTPFGGADATGIAVVQVRATNLSAPAEIIAKPGEWSQYFSVSPGSKIIPKGKIKINARNGEMVDDEPGARNNLNDTVFRVMSREDNEVAVLIQ